MPKRAPVDDVVDPVRARLAAAASAPPVTPSEPAMAVQIESKPDELPASEPATTNHPVPEPRSESPRPEPPARRERRTELRSGRAGGWSPERRDALRINRKILVTQREADQIAETTALVADAFGNKVTFSQISRVLWAVLANADDALRAGSRRAPDLPFPSKGDALGMAEYEEALAHFIATALKRA